jgi:alpha-ribazole phosphatase
MRITLLRHGDTGRRGYLDGRTDAPLSDLGWRQMRAQAGEGPWTTVVASNLQRARRPAEEAAVANGARLVIDNAWAELDFGAWDGRLRSEIETDEAAREALAQFHRDPQACPPPGGESSAQLTSRVAGAIGRLERETGTGDTLVIAHAGSIRAALALILNLPLASLWAIRLDYGARLLVDFGRDAAGGPWGQIIELSQHPQE